MFRSNTLEHSIQVMSIRKEKKKQLFQYIICVMTLKHMTQIIQIYMLERLKYDNKFVDSKIDTFHIFHSIHFN